MIANALRLEIERYAARMPTSNPLFSRAADGTFTSSCMIRYLTNIRHLVAYTKVSLSQARDRADSLGDRKLAAHYEHKRIEELGHEVWADNDIKRISNAATNPERLASIDALLSFLGEAIDEDPALYLSYALFAEYLTVLLGPAWLRLLDERCGIPQTSMTVIDNHIELDREHVEEAFDQIDALVSNPSKLPRMREILLESLAHFDRFCAEVMDESSGAAWTLDDATRHVSAA